MRQPDCKPYLVGNARLESSGRAQRLLLGRASAEHYHDAQLDDYHHLARSQMLWRPPLTLSLRARFSHGCERLRGTAGFGFWNHPILLPRSPWPALPRALWFFFASPPSDMRLDAQVPGFGWKAATIDASHLGFLLLAPTAPLAFPLMRVPALARALWPIGQTALGVREAALHAPMDDWHRYQIEWQAERARFWVDEQLVLESRFVPRAPLGLVLWIDNQYAIVTPQGRFGAGLLQIEDEQWLEIEDLRIE